MQVTETKNDELTREFRIAVPAADIEQKFEKRLGELAHNVRLPGFRPGKVPVSLLRKRYGETLRGEILEETINEATKSVIADRGIRPATPPRIEVAPSAGEPGSGDLEYTLALEVMPEVTPPDYGAIELERLVAEVTEESTDQVLGRLADATRGASPVTEARPATADDIVVFDVIAPEDKAPFGNGKDIALSLAGEGLAPGLETQLVGVEAGQTKTVGISFPADHPVAALAGRSIDYEVVVKELRVRDPLVLDDAMAQHFGAESLAALRDQVRQHQTQELKAMSRMRLKRQLLDRLDTLYAFPLPKGLVDREIKVVARQLAAEGRGGEDDDHHSREAENAHTDGHADVPSHGEDDPDHVHGPGCGHEHAEVDPATAVSESERTEYGRLAERRVRLGLVLAEIGRSNNLQVTPDELGKAIVAEARRFPGQEQAVLEFFRKNAEAKEALAAPILEEKVVDFMLEMAKVSERKVEVEELLREADAEPTSDQRG
ncbi:MAG: trigger factor [Rhodospirillales bacterium]